VNDDIAAIAVPKDLVVVVVVVVAAIFMINKPDNQTNS
jgi:hypothetical protein